MSFEIQKDIPIPPKAIGHNGGRESPYPLEKMELNDSFLIPEHDKKVRARLADPIRRVTKKTGKEFTVRHTEEGYRVWRVK